MSETENMDPLDARIFGLGIGTMEKPDPISGERRGKVSRTADFTLGGLAVMILGYEVKRRRHGVAASALPDLRDPAVLAAQVDICSEVGDVTGEFIAKVMLALTPEQRDLVHGASKICLHPWHGNPGLTTPCPECKAENF